VEPPVRSHTRFPRSTVTGAEFLARRRTAGTGPGDPVAPEAVEPDADETLPQAISVTALLRREGTGPHRADGPLVPRGHSRPAPAPAGAGRRYVRKATAVAGVLFAASSVFGAEAVDNAVRDRTVADDDAGAPDGGPVGPGKALRAFGGQAAGTGVGADPGAPVNGVMLASMAVSDSATAAVKDADPGIAGGAGAQPRLRSSESAVAEPSSGAGQRGGPGNGASGSGGPAGGPGGGPGKGRGPGGPGPGEPGSNARDSHSSGSGSHGSGGPGAERPASALRVALPKATTPPVKVPGAATDVPVLAHARTPAAAADTPDGGLGELDVALPNVERRKSVRREKSGVVADTSEAASRPSRRSAGR
jgi:hypothetical protein